MIRQRSWQTCFYSEIKMLKEKGMDIYYSENQSMGEGTEGGGRIRADIHLFLVCTVRQKKSEGVKKWRGQNLIIAERS